MTTSPCQTLWIWVGSQALQCYLCDQHKAGTVVVHLGRVLAARHALSGLRRLSASSNTTSLAARARPATPHSLTLHLTNRCCRSSQSFWNEGSWTAENRQQAGETYAAAEEAGVAFWDTAEAYDYPQGVESSEKMLGEFAAASEYLATGEGKAVTPPVIVTKFAPLPWKLGREAVTKAARASNEKLGVEADVYLLHWPFFGQEDHLDGLADAYEQGLVKAVGVSNYSADMLRAAHKQLAARGVPLATCQSQYSLLWPNPERNGLLRACEDLGVDLMAYSPLCQGLLTGKYSESNLPSGPRGQIFAPLAKELAPLSQLLREVGDAHDGASPTQVALNWLLCSSERVVPIPGANKPAHATEAAGALGWRMSDEEAEELRRVAAAVRERSVAGNPIGGLLEKALVNV